MVYTSPPSPPTISIPNPTRAHSRSLLATHSPRPSKPTNSGHVGDIISLRHNVLTRHPGILKQEKKKTSSPRFLSLPSLKFIPPPKHYVSLAQKRETSRPRLSLDIPPSPHSPVSSLPRIAFVDQCTPRVLSPKPPLSHPCSLVLVRFVVKSKTSYFYLSKILSSQDQKKKKTPQKILYSKELI